MGRVISLALVRAGKADGKALSEVVQAAHVDLDFDAMPIGDKVLAEVQREHAIKGAAWIAWKHRKQLVRGRAIDFEIDRNRKPQPFFYPALQVFEDRTDTWEVKRFKLVRGTKRLLVFRIRWIGYRKSDGITSP